jgi:hypothetical protein
MDSLLAFSLIVTILFVITGLAATLGVDSRDGFADDRFARSFR